MKKSYRRPVVSRRRMMESKRPVRVSRKLNEKLSDDEAEAMEIISSDIDLIEDEISSIDDKFASVIDAVGEIEDAMSALRYILDGNTYDKVDDFVDGSVDYDGIMRRIRRLTEDVDDLQEYVNNNCMEYLQNVLDFYDEDELDAYYDDDEEDDEDDYDESLNRHKITRI